MYFDSLQALLVMDGHGAYVWAAYAVSIAVIAVALIVPMRRRKSFLLQLSAERKRSQPGNTIRGNS
jgi:heme exporter protein D